MTESAFRTLLLRLALLPALALCVFVGVLSLQVHEITQLRSLNIRATGVLLQSDEIQRLLTDEDVSVRGYLAAKDPGFLAPYRQAAPRIQRALSSLQEAASAEPSLAPEIAVILDTYQQLHLTNVALLQSGLAGGEVVRLLQQQERAMDSLRGEFTRLNAGQNQIRTNNRNQLNVLFKRLPGIAAAGCILLAILGVWYAVRLFQQITLAFHKQFEETALQRDYLQTTLQSIADGVVVCDDYGKITLLNATAEELTGWKKADAIGRSLAEVMNVVHESTRLPVENPADIVWRSGNATRLEDHSVLIRRDGTEVPIDDIGAPIRKQDGSLCGVVLVLRSVAERRQAANALQQSQQRLTAIYQTTLAYIAVLEPAGNILDSNRASLEFAGNAREEIVGQNFWEGPWFMYTPGMPELVQTAVRRAAAGQATRTELNLKRPSGEAIQVDFALNPVLDAEGRVIYLVSEARDISDLRRAETALIQSEKLAAVGRLATSIAHEINNPLEAVTNLLYLARLQSDRQKTEEYLKAADQELRRVSVIANQTLRFHKQATSPQPIQADDLFSTVLSIYEGRLRNAHIAVEIGHRSKAPIVCFAGDVRQVLNNLVGNAIDAMSEGGRLIVRSHFTTDWATERKGMILTVADTGCGITPEVLEHIFEPFFTTKGIAGTGLGLWVSKEVVTRHSGGLTVRSRTGPSRSGTVFRLFLPLL